LAFLDFYSLLQSADVLCSTYRKNAYKYTCSLTWGIKQFQGGFVILQKTLGMGIVYCFVTIRIECCRSVRICLVNHWSTHTCR